MSTDAVRRPPDTVLRPPLDVPELDPSTRTAISSEEPNTAPRSFPGRILDAVVLPAEVTAFEDRYLARMNRLGLFFLAVHVPVLTLVAYVNGVQAAPVAALSAVIFGGALLAHRTLASKRAVSCALAFAAMCMGGTLVHSGQGPVQIEMHFYFFAVLAMLSLFGNPLVVLTGAATVAVHHAALWPIFPDSVFNYDAPLWVVAVHAGFVILETPVVCFIARNFFDNVIGLEKIVQARTAALEERNRDVRLILDHVDQGLLTIDRDGVLSSERSAIVDRWFGEPREGERFEAYFRRVDPRAAAWFQLGWDSVLEGFMPLEVTLDQLPKQCEVEGRHFAFEYTPIVDDAGELQKLLIVVSDITQAVESERAQALQREILGVFERILNDRAGFVEFYEEAGRLVASVLDEPEADWTLTKRELHTLKGNSAVFGLKSIAEACHAVEDHIADEAFDAVAAGLQELGRRWEDLANSIERLLGNQAQDAITLSSDEYEDLLRRVIDGADHVELARFLAELKLEPTEVRLQRFAEEAKAVAERLEKGAVEVHIDSRNLRVPREPLSGFWSSFTHVLRNAVDHGLEAPHQRAEAGKPEAGTLELATYLDGDDFVVEIGDDGRGIDWEAVRRKANALGVEADSIEELERALFSDGFTTRDEATSTSGRGVGLAAVRAECEQLGGRIEVQTEPGRGTRMRFRFPAELLTEEPQLS